MVQVVDHTNFKILFFGYFF